jgi:N-acetyl-beta-hexosaminidase
MRTLVLALLFAVVGFNAFSQNENNSELPLVPWPENIQVKSGKMAVNKDLVLMDASGSDEIKRIVRTSIGDLQEMGFNATDSRKQNSGRITTVRLIVEGNGNDVEDEAYRLTIDTCISIYAHTPTGIFRGTRTILQLLRKGPGSQIPQLEISDRPAFRYRGVMVDAARNFHSMDFHIRTVKKLASYKVNRYMIHFSDNESYTLPSDLYPGLPTKDRSYTKEEIRRLVETAKDYHVTIVPSVDVPGHAAALVKGIPELKFDGGRIDIAKEESYRILQLLFSEIMELFPGTYWHLGADEVNYPDITESPNESYRAWMNGLNLTKGSQLFNSFINRMYDFVKSKGKKMLVWEGFNPRLEPAINREIIVCPFDVKFEGIMPKDYTDAGYKLLNTSWTPLYIADKIYMTTPEILAKWTPYMFGAGRSPQPFSYWKKFNPGEVSTEIIGAQVCSWANEEKAEWGLWFGKEAGPGFPEYGRPEPRVQIFSERTWNSKPCEKSLLERTGAAYWEF